MQCCEVLNELRGRKSTRNSFSYLDPQKSLFLICLGKALIGMKLSLPTKKSKSEGDCVQKFLQVT